MFEYLPKLCLHIETLSAVSLPCRPQILLFISIFFLGRRLQFLPSGHSCQRTMSSQPAGFSRPANTNLDTSGLSSSSTSVLWERLTTWASENKTIVYTAAGVAVVVSGVGIVYYLSDSTPKSTSSEKKKSGKKSKKKAAQDKEKASPGEGAARQTEPCMLRSAASPAICTHLSTAQTTPAASVEADPLEGIPDVDESTVESLSDEV